MVDFISKKSVLAASFLLIILTTFFVFSATYGAKNKHFMIIIPSRNNSEWVERNLNSLCSQTYPNWHAIYLNDCSTDDTLQKAERFIKEHALQEKILLINNETRRGALGNTIKGVYMCDAWDVGVILDGDDWFKGSDVLQKLNEIYSDDNVWMTYGSYEEFPSGKKGSFAKQIPADVIKANGYRKHAWISSHLRSFYTWLFKCINLDDLKFEGEFFSTAGDVAQVIPLIELSGNHAKYIPDILYVYNLKTALNDHKINRTLQMNMEKAIRARNPYQPLKTIPTQYWPRR